MTEQPVAPVKIGFGPRTMLIKLDDIRPLRSSPIDLSKSIKYKQIRSSLKGLGSIEPPVVAEDRSNSGKYLLLDGHLRVEALRELGETHVTCLVSTDDEAFTYNKRVNRLATVQQHRMVTRAIERGVSEDRIAEVLNISPFTVSQSKRLLDGICPEVAEILKDKFVAKNAFWILRRMVPSRQIEAAELMVAMNRFTLGYARALLAASPPDQIVIRTRRVRKVKGLSDKQLGLMEKETASLERELRLVEKSYGADHLDLVLAKGYVGKLLNSAQVVRYLAQHNSDILGEFQKIIQIDAAPAQPPQRRSSAR
jgi:RepB plasmid partitioning protein/ParB-like nuclease family protein